MFCDKCGKSHSSGDKFCSECGSSLVKKQAPEKPLSQPVGTPEEEPQSRSKVKSTFLVLLAAALVSVSFGFLLPQTDSQDSSTSTGEPSESQAPRETYSPPLNIDEAIGMAITEVPVSEEKCSEMSLAISADGIFGRAQERIELMSEPKTPYEAHDFIQANSNAYVGAAANVDPEDRADYQAEILLQQLLANSDWRWSASFKSRDPGLFNRFVGAVKSRVLTECSLNTGYGDALEFHQSAVRLQQLAARKPWYPEGFTQYSLDSNIAYMWADRRCSYSSGSCAHMDVVTKSGASNLYVEVTFTDKGGAYVDWSNDTARSLRAGQIAKLEFVSFDNAVRSVRLAEITTY